jgi:glycine/D-amino acid oxidase-like deaminating enzyme
MTSLGEVDVAAVGAGIVGCSFAALATRIRPDLTVALVTKNSIFSVTNTQLSLGVDLPYGADGRAMDLSNDSVRAREILATVSPSLRGRRQSAIRVLRRAEAASLRMAGQRWEFTPDDDLVTCDSPAVVVHLPEEVVAQLAGWVHVSGSGVVYENFDLAGWERAGERIRLTDHGGRELLCRYVFVALGSGLTSSPFAGLAPSGLERRRVAAVRLRIEALQWGGAYLFASAPAALVSGEQPGTFWMRLDGRTPLAGTDAVLTGFSQADRLELDRIRVDYLSAVGVDVLEHRAGDDLYAPPATPPVVRVQDGIAVSTGCDGTGDGLGPGVARNALRLLGLA